MRRIAPSLVIIFGSLVASSSAGAWVQTTTCIDEPLPAPSSTPFCQGNETPRPFAWPQWTVPYSVNRNGYENVDGAGGEISAELLTAVREAVEVWNEPECSGFHFEYAGLTDVDEYDIEDGVNVVVFKTDTWPYQGNAIAITSVTAELDGTIVNADMELNVVDNDFGFADETEEPVWDIRNTITHEAGHMLGLDHSDVQDATMAFNAAVDEIDKRELDEDDIEGLCAIYPAGEEPEPEPDPDSSPRGCCAVTGLSTHPPAGAALLVLLFLGLLRARRLRRGD